jgi:hypothetical protein
MHIQTDEQNERFGPGGGGEYLTLDRLGRAEYVTFHGVCFPFYGLFELRFTTLWLGPAHAGQSTFPENRHRFSSHDEPYCLDGDMSMPIPIGVRIIGGTVMLASACPFVFFGISMLLRNYKLATKGTAACGAVIAFEEQQGSGVAHRRYYPKVEFQTPGGQKVIFVASVGSNAEPKLGRKVKVLYYAERAQDADVASLLRSWVFPLLLLVFAAAFLLFSLAFYTAFFGDAA